MKDLNLLKQILMAGKQGNNRITWQPWQIKYLADNWAAHTAAQLAEKVGIPRTTVRMKLYSMGLIKIEMEYWTAEQISYLKHHYRTVGDTELATEFNNRWPKKKGWTKKHIEKKRRQGELKRTPEEIYNILQRNDSNGKGKQCNSRAWATRGITPWGVVKVWEQEGILIKVIKTANGFVHYKRWLWQQIYGPIPARHVVVCKDGDQLNVKPGNLQLIPRSQHGVKNKASAKTTAPMQRKIKALIFKTTNYEKQINRP